MKVLLTGATGYVGHQLALALAQKGIIVHALIRDTNSSKVPMHQNIEIYKGDICNYASIEIAIRDCKYVFHTAAYTNIKNRNIDIFYDTNVIGTENLLKASLQYHIKKVIYTSTLSVFGPSFKSVPITEMQPRISSYANHYELTKSMSEEVVKLYCEKGVSCMVLNVSKVYGPGLKTYSSGVNKLISMFMEKQLLIVPNKLHAVSNYVFIEDVVKAHLLAMESDVVNGNYIIGGENMSYDNLFKTIKKLTNSKVKILKINYKLVKAGFTCINAIYSVTGTQLTITPKVLDFLFVNRLSNSNKAKTDLKYEGMSLSEGLRTTILYLKRTS